MAVYCPIYDPVIGWHIIIIGPKGPQKIPIVSPSHYYHSMGVSPPIGALLTGEDYEDFEDFELEEDLTDVDKMDDEYNDKYLPPGLPNFLPSLPFSNMGIDQVASTSSANVESFPSNLSKPYSPVTSSQLPTVAASPGYNVAMTNIPYYPFSYAQQSSNTSQSTSKVSLTPIVSYTVPPISQILDPYSPSAYDNFYDSTTYDDSYEMAYDDSYEISPYGEPHGLS